MANKTGAWGIKHIKFAPLVDKPNKAGGTYNSETLKATSAFPSNWAEFQLKAIVKDSLTFNDQAPSTNNIEIEDSDTYYASSATKKVQTAILRKTQNLSYRIMPSKFRREVQMSSPQRFSSGQT